jgi:FlaA1/EpsC-like NDP-sugar epimerase
MNKIYFNKFSNINKKLFLILSDFIIIILSIGISYSLRLEEIYSLWKIDLSVYLIFLIVFFIIFYLQNIYQILIRYFDYFSIRKIIKSIFLCMIILIPLNFYFYKIIYFPRSISFIAPIIIGILILSHRIFINFIINLKKQNKKNNNNILIIGIDYEIIRSIRQFPNYGVLKGLVDTSGKYKKRDLNGIKIYKKENLKNIVETKFITEIIICNKSLKKYEIKQLFIFYENKNVKIRNLTNTKNYLDSLIDNTLAPKINFFDIIDRPKIIVEKKILSKKLKNRTILVTGGGGSIGSELCLEILKHKPKTLFILDNSEINLFNIIKKLKEIKNNQIKIVKPVLGDCGDFNFLNIKFKSMKIDEIYHAAAYKHVSFGEQNPYSMIKNNIFGTKTIVDFAIKNYVKNFVFISSDKAVNPTSMLGYTKKFGEKLVKYFSDKQVKNLRTNFTIVRFGNVIGSSGSVIPIFLSQIAEKLPLTVTSKKVKRYFMSISEAVQLVINASYLNKSGTKIYALNMGEQIHIYEIAKRIIRLSGNILNNKKLNNNGNFEIKITGLKKGEKISEELSLGENLISTEHSKIMQCDEDITAKNLDIELNKIKNKLKKNNLKNFLIK